MDFQQIRDFVNPAVAQATGLQEVENLSMPVPVAYVPVQLVIDGALSLTSENPVQNKVIAVAIQNLDGRITAIEGQFSEGVTEAVNNWLAAHPEATTTVQDGAITYAKLDSNLKGEVDQISDIKNAIEAPTTLSGWIQGGINIQTGATNTYNTRIRNIVSDYSKYLYVRCESGYKIDAFCWKNGAFVGAWNGETCVLNTEPKLTIIDLQNLYSTINPDYIWFVVQNANNTVINQEEAKNNTFFIIPKVTPTSETEFIENAVFSVFNGAWQQGGMVLATGELATFSWMIRASVSGELRKISAPLGYFVALVAYYGSTWLGYWNGTTHEKVEHWYGQIDDFNYNPNYTYWVICKKITNASVTPTEGNNVNIQIIRQDKHITQSSLTTNIIWQCRDVDSNNIPPQSKWYIQSSYENQYDRVRFNVRKTTDGYFVCIHDGTINNVAVNADGSAISTSVASNDQTLSALNAYDWGLKYGTEYAGATVPLLDKNLELCALYNLGVTLEFMWSLNADECIVIFDLCAKYGLVDNLILINSSYSYANFNYWKTNLTNKVSYYANGTEEWIDGKLEELKALLTGHNSVYVQLTPIGTPASTTLIHKAAINGLKLYCSWVFNSDDLKNIGLKHGNTIIEVQNVPMIKNWAAEYANRLM